MMDREEFHTLIKFRKTLVKLGFLKRPEGFWPTYKYFNYVVEFGSLKEA